MQKNIGTMDRVVRMIIAILFGTFYFANVFAGTLGYVFLVLALVVFITGFVSFCPLYTLFGWNTCPSRKKH